MTDDKLKSELINYIEENKCDFKDDQPIPKGVICDFELTNTDIMVYLALVGHYGYGQPFSITYNDIMVMTGISIVSAKRAIQKLAEKKLLNKKRTIRENKYFIRPFKNDVFFHFSGDFLRSGKKEDIDLMRWLYLSNGNNYLPTIKYCQNKFGLTKKQRSRLNQIVKSIFGESDCLDVDIWRTLNDISD
ncbi:helix-turn-helix transcriptional regulator [Carboxylicivirga caseinilyticus]|uniref:helix-turn-helix transcriptional regulator n=1 Tax=Carboxylicivirga caseinilyticus TaxID=3417572 RepID=UPI003D35837E|nr:hypothetical protein [Marinilabiliaceae bacterium A049]